MKYTISVTVCLMIAAPLIAGDGAVPIWEPTTITEPGKYILTRNITSSSGPVLFIDSANDVHLDLGGFTVLYTGTSSYAIRATNTGSVTIRNGTVKVQGTDHPVGVELVECTGYDLNHLNIEVSSPGSVTAIQAQASNGVIRQNVINGGPVSVSDGAAQVVGNTVTNASNGIHVSTSSTIGVVVADNLVVDCGAGIVAAYTTGGTIARNTVRGCSGVGIHMTGNPLVSGTHNHIEGNVMTGNGVGLKLDHSDENVYRGNTARGNTVDFEDSGTGNTSHGDNYMPALM
jgi:parallel beta-helix repeat protein